MTAEIDAVDLYYSRPAPAPVQPPAGATAVRYEAEAGVITHARVVPDPSASAGAKVGGLDFADSSVTLTVTATHSGPATLGIRYGNGSLDRSGYPVRSSDLVSVNGRNAGTITFANTTWGNCRCCTTACS